MRVLDDIELSAITGTAIGGGMAVVAGRPARDLHIPGQDGVFLAAQSGRIHAHHAYAQCFALARPRSRTKLILLHGGGLTGALWDATAVGAPGWLMRFLAAGFDTWVVDLPGMGRAGWAPFPEVMPQPAFRTLDEAWDLFRLGKPEALGADPAAARPFPGSRFPAGGLARLCGLVVPRWPGLETSAERAVVAVAERAGPCAIVAHSSAARYAAAAAAARPDLVRALCLVEPSALPGHDARAVPTLVVFGDFIAHSAYWTRIVAGLASWRDALRAPSGWLDLPASGIAGNTHVPMLDDNADALADRVAAWLVEHAA